MWNAPVAHQQRTEVYIYEIQVHTDSFAVSPLAKRPIAEDRIIDFLYSSNR